jgi:hypothetical protein
VGFTSFLNLKLIPIDGLLQTYNSTQRMNEGQIPYRDFSPYLGLGPVYLNFLGGNLFGGTLTSQFIFVNILHLLIGIFLVLICYAIFLPKEISKKYFAPTAILLTCIYLIGMHFPFKSIFFILAEYTRPGNSALGLRAFILFATIYVCLKIERGRATFIGYFIIGLSLIWSVDYAAITFLSGCLIFRFPATASLLSILKNTIKNAVVGSSIAVVLITLLTGNSFKDWFVANYLSQKDFQYWYFGIDENFVYGISSIPFKVAVLMSFLVAVCHLFVGLNKLNVARFLIIVSTIAVGTLSQLNSAPSPRYFVFAFLAVLFGTISLWRIATTEGIKLRLLQIQLTIKYNHKISASLLTLIRISRLDSKSTRKLLLFLLAFVVSVNLFNSKNFLEKNVYVSELGGYVDADLRGSINFGKTFLANERGSVLSTYKGVASIVAKKGNETRSDYLIHALSAADRESWIKALNDPGTKTVITTREDVLRWEPWIARANWWFYSELLSKFEISKVGTYEVYWKQKVLNKDKIIPSSNFVCKFTAIDNSKAYVSVEPATINSSTYNRQLIMSIEISFKTRNNGPKGLSRNRVTITSMNELTSINPLNPNSFLNVGAPSNAENYQTYLMYTDKSSNQLLLKSSPEISSKLEVLNCKIVNVYEYASLYPKYPTNRVDFDDVVVSFRR